MSVYRKDLFHQRDEIGAEDRKIPQRQAATLLEETMFMKRFRVILALALILGLGTAGSATAAPKLNLGAASNNGGMIVFAGAGEFPHFRPKRYRMLRLESGAGTS